MLLLATCATACVTVYQPMSGLHRPLVVDPEVANFKDVRLTIHCVPEGFLNRGGANRLCRKLATLFRNQGAEVFTITTKSRFGDPEDDLEDAGEDKTHREPPATDMVMELRARLIHKENNPLLWVLCFATGTIAPSFTEYTFAQDVVIRDATGFLLVTDSLRGRFVRYFGLGAWVGNKFLDIATREASEKVVGRAQKDFSTDFYRQLSQLAFNAKMHWQVQRAATAP